MSKILKLLFFLCVPFFLFLGIQVVVSKNPVYSIFYLILFFLIGSCLIAMIGFDFLALIFVLVYVGAIAVLFLFVIMILDIKIVNRTKPIARFKFKFLKIGSYFLIGIIFVVLMQPVFFSAFCFILKFVAASYCFFLEALWPFIDYSTIVNDEILHPKYAFNPHFLIYYEEEFNHYLLKVVENRYYRTNFYYSFLTLVDTTNISFYVFFFTSWGLPTTKSLIFYRLYKDCRPYEYKQAFIGTKKFPGVVSKIFASAKKTSFFPKKISVIVSTKHSFKANRLSIAAKKKVVGPKFGLALKKAPVFAKKIPVLVRRLGNREKALLEAYKAKTQLSISLKKISVLSKKAFLVSNSIKTSIVPKKFLSVFANISSKKKGYVVLSKMFTLKAKSGFVKKLFLSVPYIKTNVSSSVTSNDDCAPCAKIEEQLSAALKPNASTSPISIDDCAPCSKINEQFSIATKEVPNFKPIDLQFSGSEQALGSKKFLKAFAVASQKLAKKSSVALKKKEVVSAAVKKGVVAGKKGFIAGKKKKAASVIIANTSFGYYLPNFDLDKPFPLYTLLKLPENSNKYLRVREEMLLTENFIFTRNKIDPLMDHIFWVDFDSTIKNLQVLYTDFSILFLLGGGLLLIAMTSCICLTLSLNHDLKKSTKTSEYFVK